MFRKFVRRALGVESKLMLFISIVITQFLLVSSFWAVSAAMSQDNTDAGTVEEPEVVEEGELSDVHEIAEESATTGGQTGCIDVQSVYREASLVSRDTTGMPASIDSLKRGDFAASALIYAGLLYGSDMYCSETSSDELSAATQRGILGTVDSKVLSMVYTPPSVHLPHHLARQFVPGYEDGPSDPSAYAAASTGYSFLKDDLGLEPVWEMFRNVAYAGFLLVIMVSGFAIMFRSKLSGAVTASIMNTIPMVLVGLVLVTFSFAIVGFILDIGRLLMFIIWEYMDTSLLSSGFQSEGLKGILGMFNDAFTNAYPNGYLKFGVGIGKIIVGEAILNSEIDSDIPGVDLFLDSALGIAKIAAAGLKVWGIIDVILVVIVGVVCLYAAVRLFLTIVLTYMKIIVETILGPIYILIGSLPGNSGTIVAWVKRVITHSLTFVLIFVIINLVRYLAANAALDQPLTFFNSTDFVSDAILSMRGVIVIGGYLIAAGSPAIVEDLLQVKESRGVMSAVEGAKKAAGKVPVVGGLFGS